MLDENELAENLIPGGLKKSASYHSRLGKLTFKEIKRRLRKKHDPDRRKLQQMKKLIVEQARLLQKKRGQKQ